jgi:cathepsin C
MASISALEARFRVKSKMALRPILSPQEVVSCSFYNQGCEGGYPFLVAKHGAEFGLVNAECVPYTARNSACTPICNQPRLKLSNYSYVGGFFGGCNEVHMMREIYENGPVMVAFQAPPDLFYYTGGIYTGPSPKEEAQGVNGVNVWQQTNHAVVAVGWGVDKRTGVKYWKLKNTWGLKWGESGYFRIRRGTNECGVESMATKADVLLPSSIKVPEDAPNPWSKVKKNRKHKHRFIQRKNTRRYRNVRTE